MFLASLVIVAFVISFVTTYALISLREKRRK